MDKFIEICDYQAQVNSEYTLEKEEPPDCVLLKHGRTGGIVRLNTSAVVIWNLCDGFKSVASIVRRLASKGDFDPAEIATDVAATILQFEELGLINLYPAGEVHNAENPSTQTIKPRQSKRKIDSRYRLVSHRRSGTHFLWELMRLNLGAGVVGDSNLWDIPKIHGLYQKATRRRVRNRIGIYVVRDCRDVQVSNYCYWADGGERKVNVQYELRRRGFSQFLRGGVSLGNLPEDIAAFASTYFKAPVQYWVDHTAWADHLLTVRYEDLKIDPVGVLARISKAFDLPFDANRFQPLDSLVGHLPRKGVSGDWRDWFNDDDLEYLQSIAAPRMEQLGYRTGRQASTVRVPEISDFWVINLDRRTDRAASIATSLQNAGVTEFRRFPALDGRDFANVDEVLATCGMTLNPRFAAKPFYDSAKLRFRAKAGCWCSHLQIIDSARGGSGWTVVLEDDVLIDFTKEVLQNRLWHTEIEHPDADIVVLGQRRGLAAESGRRGTDAYAFRNDSAEKIAGVFRTDAADNETLAADDRLVYLRETGQLQIAALSGAPWASCVEVGRGRDSDIERGVKSLGRVVLKK